MVQAPGNLAIPAMASCVALKTCSTNQFIEVKPPSWLRTQVFRINAELLHFHFSPPASESGIGGVDLIGAKSAAQASVRNATVRKGRFIAILPISGVCRLAPLFRTRRLIQQRCYQALVSVCFRGSENGFVQWGKLLRGRLADETSSQDRDRAPGC